MNMDASSQISKCLEKVNSNNSSRHATGSNRGILQTETKAFKVFFFLSRYQKTGIGHWHYRKVKTKELDPH